jgi:hypothetical protein
MTAQHTPGPWIIHKSKCTFVIQSSTEPRAGLIGHVYAKGDLSADQSSYSKPEEAEANAKLIAAAPDLLEALRLAYKWSNDWPDDVLLQVQETLANAGGVS